MITLKRKEAKTMTFTITDEAGGPVDVSEATLSFEVKEVSLEAAAVITKADEDFDKTDAATGIVSIDLSAVGPGDPPTVGDLDRTGRFTGELKIHFAADNIDKSIDIGMEILEAVTA